MDFNQVMTNAGSLATTAKTVIDTILTLKEKSTLPSAQVKEEIEKILSILESFKDKAIELEKEILTLKSENLENIIAFQAKLRDTDIELQDVSKELQEYRNWEAQEKLFPIVSTAGGTMVRRSKEIFNLFLCPTCFDVSKFKVPLQPYLRHYQCPKCKTEYQGVTNLWQV